MINDEYKGRPPIQGIISLPTNRLVPQLGIFKQVRHSIHTHLRIFYQVFFVNICVIKLIECDKNAEVVCHRLMSPTPSMLLSKVSESGSPLSTINQVVRHHWKLTDPIDTLLQPEVENMLHLLHHRRVPIVQVRLCCLEQKHHKRIQILKLRFEGFGNLVLVIVILTTPFRPSPGRTSDLIKWLFSNLWSKEFWQKFGEHLTLLCFENILWNIWPYSVWKYSEYLTLLSQLLGGPPPGAGSDQT